MSSRADCRKFSPNVFNRQKCASCFRSKDCHDFVALESNKESRTVLRCGFLFVAPDWDFSVPVSRTKKWQRRWFTLYSDGELTYSIDNHPETVPQGVVDVTRVTAVTWAEEVTGHQHSVSLCSSDRITFIKGTSRDESKWWIEALQQFINVAKQIDPRDRVSVPGAATPASLFPPSVSDTHLESPVSFLAFDLHGHYGLRQSVRVPAEKEDFCSIDGHDSGKQQHSCSSSGHVPTETEHLWSNGGHVSGKQQHSCPSNGHVSTETEHFCSNGGHVSVSADQSASRSALSMTNISPTSNNLLHSADLSLAPDKLSRKNQKRQDPEGGVDVTVADSDNVRSAGSISGCSERKLSNGLPQKRGWLMRQDDNQEWCRQWAVLCDTRLMFYPHSTSSIYTGLAHKCDYTIDLSLASSVTSVERSTHYAFTVMFSDNTSIVLATTTGSIRAKWILSLSNVINNNKNKQHGRHSSVWSTDGQIDRRALCLPAERDTAAKSTNDNGTHSSSHSYRGCNKTCASADSLSEAINSYEIAAGRLFSSSTDVYGGRHAGDKSYTSVYQHTLSRVRSESNRKMTHDLDQTRTMPRLSGQHGGDVSNNNNNERLKRLELLVQSKNTEIKSLRDEVASVKQKARDSVRSDKSDLYKLKDLVRDLRSLLSDRNAEIERLRSSSVGNGTLPPEASQELTDSDGADTTDGQRADSPNQQSRSCCDEKLARAVCEIRSLQKQLHEADDSYHDCRVQCAQLRRFIQAREEEHRAEVALFTARLHDLTDKLCQSEKQLRALKTRTCRGASTTDPPMSPAQPAVPPSSDSVSRIRRQRSLSLRSRSDSQSNLTTADWRELSAKLARLEQRVAASMNGGQQQGAHRYEESTRASRLRRKSLDGSRQSDDCLRVALRIDALNRRLAETETRNQDSTSAAAVRSSQSLTPLSLDDVISGDGRQQLIARACQLLRAKFEQLQSAEAGSWYSRHVQKLVYISLVLSYISRISDESKQAAQSSFDERQFLLAETDRRSHLLEKLVMTSSHRDIQAEHSVDVTRPEPQCDITRIRPDFECDVTLSPASGGVSDRPIACISTVEEAMDRLVGIICSSRLSIENNHKITAHTSPPPITTIINNNNNNNNNSNITNRLKSVPSAAVADAHVHPGAAVSEERSELAPAEQKLGSLQECIQRKEKIDLAVRVYRRRAVKHLARALLNSDFSLSTVSSDSTAWSTLAEQWRDCADNCVNADKIDCDLASTLRKNVTMSLGRLQFDRNHLVLFSGKAGQAILDKTYDGVADKVRNDVASLIGDVQCEYERLSKFTDSDGAGELPDEAVTYDDGLALDVDLLTTRADCSGSLSACADTDSLIAELVCVVTHYCVLDCGLQRLTELSCADPAGKLAISRDSVVTHPLSLFLPVKKPLTLLEAQMLMNSAIDNCLVDFQQYGLVLPSGESLDDFCSRTSQSIAAARAECQAKLQQSSADHRKQLAALQKELDTARRVRLRSKSVDKSRRRVSDVSDMLRSSHVTAAGAKDDSGALPPTPCGQCAQLLLKMHSLERDKASELESLKSSQKLSLESLQRAMTTEVDKVTESYESEKRLLCEQVVSLRQRLHSLESDCQQQQQQRQQERKQGEELSIRRAEFEESVRRRYQTEIDQLRSLCEKGLVAMEKSHQRVLADLAARHGREMARLHEEKRRALAEETQATLAALDALRKAHRSEVQREVAQFKQQFASQLQPAAPRVHRCELDEVRAQTLEISQKYSDKCMEVAVLRERVAALTHQLDLLRSAPPPTKDVTYEPKSSLVEKGDRLVDSDTSRSAGTVQSDKSEPLPLQARLARAARETQQLKQQLYDTQKKEADMETVCRQLCVFLRTGEQLKSEDVVALRDRLEHIVLSSPRFIADCIRPDNEISSEINGGDNTNIGARQSFKVIHNRAKDLVRSPSCPRLFTPLNRTSSGLVSPLLGMVASRKMVFEQGGGHVPPRSVDHGKSRNNT